MGRADPIPAGSRNHGPSSNAIYIFPLSIKDSDEKLIDIGRWDQSYDVGKRYSALRTEISYILTDRITYATAARQAAIQAANQVASRQPFSPFVAGAPFFFDDATVQLRATL